MRDGRKGGSLQKHARSGGMVGSDVTKIEERQHHGHHVHDPDKSFPNAERREVLTDPPPATSGGFNDVGLPVIPFMAYR
jgi:hypothetical protein